MQKGNRLVVEKAYLTLQGLLNGGNGEDSGELRNAHIILLRAESLFYQGTGFGINSTAYNQKTSIYGIHKHLLTFPSHRMRRAPSTLNISRHRRGELSAFHHISINETHP
jgi:hypothetical protein